MNTFKTTATAEQLQSWLDKSLQSATRGANTANSPSFKKLWEDEAAAIRKAKDEIRLGGSQEEIERKK